MTKISAEIIADSICNGFRITTMKLIMPRIVLSEFNTHRMFSRNSASSRAIPILKMIRAVQEDPFIPLKWMKDHSGMQGTDYLDESDSWHANNTWLIARDHAVSQAVLLSDRYKVTKQLCNRLLEPFMWHTVLVTATEWGNFFALRANEAAEIHMQELAHKMLEAYNINVPTPIDPGGWHIPYDEATDRDVQTRLKMSVARCAQTSYTIAGEDGKPTGVTKLVALHDRLLAAGHMSPFEHCAKAMSEKEFFRYIRSRPISGDPEINRLDDFQAGWCHNFHGWVSYRSTCFGENRFDNRLKHHNAWIV